MAASPPPIDNDDIEDEGVEENADVDDDGDRQRSLWFPLEPILFAAVWYNRDCGDKIGERDDDDDDVLLLLLLLFVLLEDQVEVRVVDGELSLAFAVSLPPWFWLEEDAAGDEDELVLFHGKWLLFVL